MRQDMIINTSGFFPQEKLNFGHNRVRISLQYILQQGMKCIQFAAFYRHGIKIKNIWEHELQVFLHETLT